MDDHLVLMDEQRIHRSARRMAHEIIETNQHDAPILLIGIDERGFATAELLGKVLEEVWDGTVQTTSLSIDEDDTKKMLGSLKIDNTAESFPIVVDDVIFSGETMFRSLTKLAEHLSLSEVYTAVLVDRGHRKFPIRAEFYGMQLPTKPDEHVSVIVDGDNVRSVQLQSSS